MLPELRTARLLLRSFEDRDASAFAAINADPQVMELFPAPLSRAESDALIVRVRQHAEARGFGIFAVELATTHEFIGSVGLTTVGFEAHFTPAVELVWRLAAEHWAHGYATEAARAVLRFGFERPEMHEVVAFTVPHNQRSRRVMEKLGMRHDPREDFDHLRVQEGHPLRRHVLYRIDRVDFTKAEQH